MNPKLYKGSAHRLGGEYRDMSSEDSQLLAQTLRRLGLLREGSRNLDSYRPSTWRVGKLSKWTYKYLKRGPSWGYDTYKSTKYNYLLSPRTLP